ncbi:thermonuclease family protein [Mycoplasma seminis]|uniref:Thermonuclease family protein n=1 Tax=Mycoplasma seminis TaxID=512749 RepID=A0ABY9HB50_9MOLU|nr:thermonuclease family protein [Mycoplasma seminis]WLP85822.1 thermonuclease family protein [Mycoplasma seminis]
MNFKLKKFLLIGTVLPITMIATPAIAVSCDFTPIKEAYSQNKRINYSKDTVIKTFNVDFKSKYSFKFTIDENAESKIKTAKVEPVKRLAGLAVQNFNNALEELTNDINKIVSDNFKIKYEKQEGSTYLLPSVSRFSNVPREFHINVKNPNGNTVVLKYVLKSFDQSFKNWETGLKLGVKGQNDQDAALELKNLDALTNFVYMPFINKNTEVVELSSSVTFSEEVTINPLLSEYPTTIQPQNFKSTNIDWNKMDPSSYFDGAITSVADGDTFTVQASADKTVGNNVGLIEKGSSHVIRLAGIDTPEKAVGGKDGATNSAPFEYAFALMPTHFAEGIYKQYGSKVRVAFVEGKDTYGRLTADVFFGDNYQYSYNTEVVRAGFTLPLAKGTVTVNNYNSSPNSYESVIYPQIAVAMHEAEEAKRGFFHYFETPGDISRFIYLIKPNTSFVPFEEIYNKISSTEKK